MDMPLSLQTLPAEALDILRYYGRSGGTSLHADDITEGAGLTDRGFGKGIRRLVTRNYLSMAGEQLYRLTDQGHRAVAALQAYDQDAPGDVAELALEDADDPPPEPRTVRRRLVIIAPARLLAMQPTSLTIGVDDAQGEDLLAEAVNVLLRVSVINGDPASGYERTLVLENRYVSHTLEVTAGMFTRLRVRAELYQELPDEQYAPIGGLYVDVPVTAELENADATLTAYGSDFLLREYLA